MINKQELEWAIANKAGCKKYEAENFLEAFKEVIKDYLVAGETVNLRNFCRIEVKEYKSRLRRNGFKNVLVEIPPCKKVKFKVSKVLKNEINKGFAEKKMDEKVDE